MKLHIKSTVVIACLMAVSAMHAQDAAPPAAPELYDATAIKVFNFTHFDAKNQQEGTDEIARMVDPSALTHPEFGVLPFDAPCTDCIELIDRRTSNTRYYVKRGTNGTKYYSQACETDLHYKNERGEWITIDPRLYPQAGTPNVYAAPQQGDPTTLNMAEGFTSIRLMNNEVFKFNQGLISYTTSDFTTYNNMQFINRNDYTVGNEGAKVSNAFNDIDQELIFGEARIKSSYYVKSPAAVVTDDQYYVIEDAFTLPAGYQLKYDRFEGSKNDHGFWYGDLILENENGIELARIDAPIIYDSNPVDTMLPVNSHNIIGYSIEQTGNDVKLKMIIETSYLKNPGRVFPIVIDPTVFGTTATWTGVSGTDDSPTFCTTTLSVPTPANATLTGCSVYWEFVASGLACSPFCKLKYMQVRVGTSCGYSPSAAGVWTCPACNTAGTWLPTLVKTDVGVAGMVTCMTPSCASYNILFTLYHNQYQCVTTGGCVTTCDFMQKFQVTIEGETVTATALVEGGSSTYTVTDCTDQSGFLSVSTPNYGVPGYTYSWSPIGATTTPVYVTYPMGTTNYTLTITDACGNTYSDVITVINNCLTLPIELISFTGHHEEYGNVLNWTTESELHNKNFIVQRSYNGIDFEDIGTVDGNGTTEAQHDYTFTDRSPYKGTNYYRLKQVNDDESFGYSDMIAIKPDNSSTADIIINSAQPVSGDLQITILSPESGLSDLLIYDITGKLVLSQPIQLQGGNTSTSLNIDLLAKGTYVATLHMASGKAEAKFVK